MEKGNISVLNGGGGGGRFFTLGLVASWYSSNIGVLLLNKYLLSNYGFRYPIFLTMCHMTACSLLSYVAIAWMRLVPMQPVRSRVQLLKISALSLVFCGSVVSGNVSLRYLPVSFNQAVGATTPFFTAVFAYLVTLRREAWLTYLTLVPVVAGVIIASGVNNSLGIARSFFPRNTCSQRGSMLSPWFVTRCFTLNIFGGAIMLPGSLDPRFDGPSPRICTFPNLLLEREFVSVFIAGLIFNGSCGDPGILFFGLSRRSVLPNSDLVWEFGSECTFSPVSFGGSCKRGDHALGIARSSFFACPVHVHCRIRTLGWGNSGARSTGFCN